MKYGLKPSYTAIDVAVTEGRDSDWTFAIRGTGQGEILDYDRFRLSDYMMQVGRLAGYAQGTTCLIDSTGVGKTIADMLEDEGLAVERVNWTGPLKREMIGRLAGAIDREALIFAEESDWQILWEELTHYERKFKINGEPTDQYGSAPGFTDDGVSALLMYSHKVFNPSGFQVFTDGTDLVTLWEDGRETRESLLEVA